MPRRNTKIVEPTSSFEKFIPYLLIVGGIIGVICSFIISVDKVKLLENPSFKPSCDLNPIVSCGSVMASHQGSAFGFPNPWIGLATFAVLATVGVAILAGAKFKRWFWLGLEGGIALGLLFAYWLLFESVYTIQALCPYCLTVDVVVITTFWYVGLYLLDKQLIKPPASWKRVLQVIRRHHLDILILWFVILILVILKHFWYYYGRYL
jgi:uncharacterized membrane protein